VSGILHNAVAGWIVAAALALAVAGLSAALVSGSPNPVGASTPFRGSGPGSSRPFGAGPGFSGRSFSNLSVFGTVASVGTGKFTVTDNSGGTVTVTEQSSTTYDRDGSSTSSSAVVTGVRVAVQGTRSGNAVTATQVTVLPAGGFGTGPFS